MLLYKMLALIVAFMTSLLLTPLVTKLALRVGAVDKPNERKIHKGLIPRLGGVAIYISFMLSLLLFTKITTQMIGIILGGTIIMIVGVIDDLKELSPKYKLLGQILAAVVLIIFDVSIKRISNPLGGGTVELYLLNIPITIIWVVGIVNAINLIDGLDGLAAGVSTIALTILAITSWLSGEHAITLSLCLAASILGFLKYNFNPAKIFLGDSGSMYLGFNLGAFAILGLSKSAALVSIFIPIVILGIPISDTFIAIIRRYINKQPIFSADKGHLHHQLLALGLSQRKAVLIIYATSMFFGGVAIILTKISSAQALMLFMGLATVVAVVASKIGLFASSSRGIGRLNWMEQVNDKYHKGA